ncbi:DUF397 domain-containing protein [Actinomadura scrupuli]|uniref:DUF397 domain-containing protein n=1 Tax=Actinomadura scrupuli TaxID=559629 RepID=UPI003D96E1CF
MAAQSDRDPELTWRKSKASIEKDSCVEVAELAGSVLVRDSRHPSNGAILLAAAQWRRLLERLRDGALSVIPAVNGNCRESSSSPD